MAGDDMVKVRVYGKMEFWVREEREMPRKEYLRLREDVERVGDEALIDAFDLKNYDPINAEFEAYDFEIVKPDAAKEAK